MTAEKEYIMSPVTNFPHGITTDETKHQTMISGSTIPAAGTADYNPGCKFTLTNATLGQCMEWVNIGTATSCLFVPTGLVYGYGFALAGGPVDLEDAAALTAVSLPAKIQAGDLCLATKCVTTGADQFRSVAPTSGKDSMAITINAADPTNSMDAFYAALRDKCVPGYDIFAAGEYVAVTGDGVAVAITVTGVLATDIAFVNFLTTDDTDTINLVACTADTVTVTVSADPEVAHSFSYMVLRPRGTFTPSHYVAYCGEHTTLGSDPAEALTVTGVLATDIVISGFSAADDDDCFIESVIASANTITWTFTQDPVTDHKLIYAVLRAY